MTYYERNLPHWHPDGKDLFITWRLHGSLPKLVLSALPRMQKENPGKAFAYADRHLDRATFGPVWLKDPRIAQLVMASLHKGARELQHYKLHAFVVMANHVHVLLEPKADLAKIMHGLKGTTARLANRLLRRTGQPFWQDESFDHWIRNGREFEKTCYYIEHNPVKVGLVAKPEHWPWSSATQ